MDNAVSEDSPAGVQDAVEGWIRRRNRRSWTASGSAKRIVDLDLEQTITLAKEGSEGECLK